MGQISLIEIERQMSLTWEEFNKTEPEKRKGMWDKFKTIFPEMSDEWEDMSACYESNCHYSKNGWCNYTDFPCGYNPYVTPKTGYSGMACMGCVPSDDKT